MLDNTALFASTTTASTLPNDPVEVDEPLIKVDVPSRKLLAVASVLVNRVDIEALGTVPSNTLVNPLPSPMK